MNDAVADRRGKIDDLPEIARLLANENFVTMLDCIQSVDVMLMVDNFVGFSNGGKAAEVRPILQYVDANFDCLRVDDRQVCTRRPN